MWAVADPGTGKSHAADPHLDLIKQVCAEQPEYSVGTPPHFHVVTTRTYAALEDTLKETGGYGLVLAGEGKPLCSPTWRWAPGPFTASPQGLGA